MNAITHFRSLASIHIAAAFLGVAVALSTAAQEQGDACTLLSSDELARIVGQTVRQPSPDEAEEGTACRFPTATDTVVISLWPTDDRAFEDYRGTLSESGDELEPVEEIGDAAYFKGDRLYARKGTQALTVYLAGSGEGDDERRRETVIAIANAALAKLQ